MLKVDPPRLGEFLSLLDANPRLSEYCLILELWLDRFAVRASGVDLVQSRIIRRLPRVRKLMLNSAATALRNKDGSVQTVPRSYIGLPLDETLSAMRAATWITALVMTPCYDQYWSHQVFMVFSLHITHLTLSIKEPNTIPLLIGFPECPQLRHIELPHPVLNDVAGIFRLVSQSPNLCHFSISHLKVDAAELQPNITKAPISHEPLNSLNLSYVNNAKFLRLLVSFIPTHTLAILFESENHALDLKNITEALFSNPVTKWKLEQLKVLRLERSGRRVERSTIDERTVALEALKEYCIRSKVELDYHFPVSPLCVPLLRGWLIYISGA